MQEKTTEDSNNILPTEPTQDIAKMHEEMLDDYFDTIHKAIVSSGEKNDNADLQRAPGNTAEQK